MKDTGHLTIGMGNQEIPLEEIEDCSPCLLDKNGLAYTAVEVELFRIAKTVRGYATSFMPKIGRKAGGMSLLIRRPELVVSINDVQRIYKNTGVQPIEGGDKAVSLGFDRRSKQRRYKVILGVPIGWGGWETTPMQDEVNALFAMTNSEYRVRIQILPVTMEKMLHVMRACSVMELSMMEIGFLLSLRGGADLCLRRGLPPPDGSVLMPSSPSLAPAIPPKEQVCPPATVTKTSMAGDEEYKQLTRRIADVWSRKRAISRHLQELRHGELFYSADEDAPSVDKDAMREMLNLYGENVDLTDQLCALQAQKLDLLERRYRDHLLSEIHLLVKEADFLG